MGQGQVEYVIAVILVFGQLVSTQLVNTTLGAIKGTTLSSRGGRTINAYLGIPYSSPPTGSQRFLEPKPARPWEGIRDGSSYGPICQQHGNVSGEDVPQDEDCLTLNVFTPNKNMTLRRDKLLPVLVYLHGGYFMVLSGSNYGPKYIMDHDVIFVTLNYRLGAIGFLSTEDENAPGNAGIKDQVLALKWVQDNVAHFGGDPKRVTIYGESAGGAAVHYHLVSPMSRGLFSAAISGSGTSFKIYSHQVSPLKAAQKIAQEVGCGDKVGNTSEMVNCLRLVEAKDLAQQNDEYMKVLKDPHRTYSPSTEVNGSSDTPFLIQHPYEVLASGNQQRVPWMVGVNSGEGFQITLNILNSETWIQEMNANWTRGLANEFLLLNYTNLNITSSIDDFYLNTLNSNGSVDFRRDLMGFTDLITDRHYVHASIEAARLQANSSPVFIYYNDYITTANPIGLGTVHGEELALLFSPRNFSDPIIDENHPDYEQSRTMVDLWIQFVKDPHNVKYNNQRWNPVNNSESDMNCLIFRNSNRGEQGFAKLPDAVKNRVNFWRELEVPPYEEYLDLHQ